MTVPKYLNLEISIASFKYFRTVKQKKNKFVCSVFGRIYGAQICLQFYLTFTTQILILSVKETYFIEPNLCVTGLIFARNTKCATRQNKTEPVRKTGFAGWMLLLLHYSIVYIAEWLLKKLQLQQNDGLETQ